ncbi:metallophosphoesterase [Thalassiella azotivora]
MGSVLKRAAAVLAVVLALLLVYGVLVEPRVVLDERRYTQEVPGLGDEWEGAEVAVLSDLQVGMWFANTGMVERAVDRVAEADPDVVLLGGDFLYSSDPDPTRQADTVLDLLAPVLDGDAQVVAVLGNHDHAVGATEELTAALEGRGVQVLQNEAVTVDHPAPGGPSQPLHVVGLGSERAGLADAEAALRGVPDAAPRIVLMHNPTSFPSLPAGSAPLAVAGHTHCGQVALPGAPDWSYLGLSDEEAVVADGFAPQGYGAESNTLFVTCGLGFSLLPMRINAPPQVVFFELTANG